MRVIIKINKIIKIILRELFSSPPSPPASQAYVPLAGTFVPPSPAPSPPPSAPPPASSPSPGGPAGKPPRSSVGGSGGPQEISRRTQ